MPYWTRLGRFMTENAPAYYPPVMVRSLCQTLILPLRLSYSGQLAKDERDQKPSSAERMKKLAAWVVEASGGNWETEPELYERSGLFPGQFPNRGAPWAISPSEDAFRYSTALYFHPFIRDLFFRKEGPQGFEVLRHTKVRGVKIAAGGRAERHFSVNRCHLFLFPCNIAVLALGIEWKDGVIEADPMLLREAQDLLNRFRRLYPPYYDGNMRPGEVVDSACWTTASGERWGSEGYYDNAEWFRGDVYRNRRVPMARHWKAVLSPLTTGRKQPEDADGVGFEQVVDERIPSMVFAALDRIENVSPGDFARLVFLDGPGDPAKMPASPAFLGDLAKFTYDRRWAPDSAEHMTTRFLCCDYNFALVAAAHDDFGCNVLPVHFLRHYFFMGLLAWLHKAALLGFWGRLTDVVTEFSAAPPSPEVKKKFFEDEKWLLSDLSDFVTRFYFSEVSNQVQGVELFKWWTGHLKTAELYSQVMEQTKFLREVQMSHWQEEMQAQSTKLQQLANAAIPLSLAIGVVAYVTPDRIVGWWNGSEQKKVLMGQWPTLAALFGAWAFFWLCFWGYGWFKRRRKG